MVDDGAGMTRAQLHCMLGFGFSDKEHVQGNVGRFGIGFKSGKVQKGGWGGLPVVWAGFSLGMQTIRQAMLKAAASTVAQRSAATSQVACAWGATC